MPARSWSELRVEGRAGRRLRWLWRVSSGDVDFVVMKGDKEVSVLIGLLSGVA